MAIAMLVLVGVVLTLSRVSAVAAPRVIAPALVAPVAVPPVVNAQSNPPGLPAVLNVTTTIPEQPRMGATHSDPNAAAGNQGADKACAGGRECGPDNPAIYPAK